MSTKDLSILSSEDLIEFIESGANPSSFLHEAVKSNRLDLLRVLLSYGADVRELFNTELQKDEFIYSCPTEICNYLNLYVLNSGANTLSDCLDELATAMFGRYFVNRGFHFKTENKISLWTIGLTEREAVDPDFINNAIEILDIGDWESRFVNVDPKNTKEHYILMTIEDLNLNQLDTSTLNDIIDPLDISPNASLALRIYLVPGCELYNLLGQIAFEGGQEFLGINRTDIGTLFRNDGFIDSTVYDRMKNVVSKYYEAKNR